MVNLKRTLMRKLAAFEGWWLDWSVLLDVTLIALLYQMSRNNPIIYLLLLALLAVATSAKKQLYYLYDQEPHPDNQSFQQILENPYDIPVLTINCKQKQCQKYKAPTQYPQLVFWNGPGCSYKTMQAPSLAALEQHFDKVNGNPIKPLRDFLERISLTEAFGVAFGFGTFLYIVFTKLFTDRSKVKPQ